MKPKNSLAETAGATDPPDTLVPDPQVFAEFGITPMTGHRWDHDQALIALGWPAPAKIRLRKFRSRRQLEKFKSNMLKRAIEQRKSAVR